MSKLNTFIVLTGKLMLCLALVFKVGSISAQPEIDLNKIREVVVNWNNAHNDQDEDLFRELYSKELLFYAKTMDRNQAITIKMGAMRKGDFSQTIIGDLLVTAYEGDILHCAFTKRTKFGSKNPKEYPSYLVLAKADDEYVISGEGDLITDRRLNFTPLLGVQLPSSELKVIPVSGPFDANQFSLLGYQNKYGSPWLFAGSAVLLALVGLIFIVRRKRKPHLFTASVPTTPFNEPNADRPFTLPVPQRALLLREPERKGYAFEQYIVDRFNQNKNVFFLKHWSSDKRSGNVYPESSRNPDLQYEFKLGALTALFAVECKYRKGGYEIDLARTDQLRNYDRFEKEHKTPVFIVLGLGGTPSKPEELYIIRLRKVKETMGYQELQPFRTKKDYFYFDGRKGTLT